MSNYFRWRKLKNADISAVETLLRENEKKYVSACARFITRDASNCLVWVLCGKKNEIAALIINSRSTLLPVFFEKKEIPMPDFIGSLSKKKKIHSMQGLTEEVIILEDIMNRMGKMITDIYDYHLMNLDSSPKQKTAYSCPENLTLKIPQLIDLNEIAPLQAAYEQEEVVPKGSVFSPAASRINISNIIANGQVLAAQINGRLIGKINVNAVSYTRYQVGGVYVRPDYRGQGIAGKMAAEFISSLINQGRGITLFVKKSNIPACSLYQSLGFSIQNSYRITYY